MSNPIREGADDAHRAVGLLATRVRMNIASRGAVGCLAALLVCMMIPQTGHAQAPSPGVFSALQTELVPQISVALQPATMRSRVVQVDTGQVTAARLGRETLRLNLFDDSAVAVRIDRVRPTRSGYFIAGHPEGMEWGEVRLVVNGPVMVGTVVTPEGTYTIRFGGSGRHVIRQIDPSAEPPQHDVMENPLPPDSPPAILPGDPLASIARPTTAMADPTPTEDGSEIRVLVVYTPALQAEQGGAAGMQAVIDLMIQSANHAFEISGINPRLVLARTALVDYVETDRSTDLGRLRSPDDGYMDEVHALRNEHATDLVHLLTGGLRFSGGGIASRLREADLRFADFAAFALTQGTSEIVFTHEIGHNFGLLHDRFVDLDKTSIYPYAFGYANNRAFEPGAPATARWRDGKRSWHIPTGAARPVSAVSRFSVSRTRTRLGSAIHWVFPRTIRQQGLKDPRMPGSQSTEPHGGSDRFDRKPARNSPFRRRRPSFPWAVAKSSLKWKPRPAVFGRPRVNPRFSHLRPRFAIPGRDS